MHKLYLLTCVLLLSVTPKAQIITTGINATGGSTQIAFFNGTNTVEWEGAEFDDKNYTIKQTQK